MPHICDNIMVVTVDELVPRFWPSWDALRRKLDRELNKPYGIRRAKEGKGAGNHVLIAFDTLPYNIRELIGDLRSAEHNTMIKVDGRAVNFYASYVMEDGRNLSPDHQREYSNNAAILNALKEQFEIGIGERSARTGKKLTKKEFFEKKAKNLREDEDLNRKWHNSLPNSSRRLEEAFNAYVKESYVSLISDKFLNKNKRLVTPELEALWLSIYAMKDKPFGKTVHDMYVDFAKGEIEIVDYKTGEFFDRTKLCYNKKGELFLISEQTLRNYLNKPENRVVVDLLRNDSLYYSRVHRPYQLRRSPDCSFSKISMDDRDLPTKCTDGKKVVAYYAYDVASGAVVGASHSKDKDLELVKECFINMFRYVDKHDLAIPEEVEVEHHLMNKIEDDLNNMFHYVRFCAPGNSREKRAEHFNKSKKYSADKKISKNVTGRWWAKCEAYIKPTKREGAEYVEDKLPYSRLVQEDLDAIAYYNNMPHPDQEKYPGMTRLQVLHQRIFADAVKINKSILYRIIGNCTKTTIRNNKLITCQHGQYSLSHPRDIERLQPNNYQCQAYWLEDTEGKIDEVYLYQGEEYISTCKLVRPYNEARCEQTDEDRLSMLEQNKYNSKFDAMVKKSKADKITKLAILDAKKLATAESKQTEIVDEIPVNIDFYDDLPPDDMETVPVSRDYSRIGLNSL